MKTSYSFQFNKEARPAGLEPAPFRIEAKIDQQQGKGVVRFPGRVAETLFVKKSCCA